MNQVLQTIQMDKVVVIARNVPADVICDLAGAIFEGGLHCIEVTFNHSDAGGIENTLKSIRLLGTHFSNKMHIGAGTVLAEDEVKMAAEAGASYIISPDMREEVIRETKKQQLISIPGAMTPTEIRSARDFGADLVKLFPASSLGPAYFKAIRGPLPDIPLLATGGINAGNIGQYLSAGAVGAGVGGNLVSLKSIYDGDFAAITRAAQEYVSAIREVEKH